MKKILSIILSILIIVTCFSACTTTEQEANVQKTNEQQTQQLIKTASLAYNGVSPRYDNLILYKKGAKIGVLDNNGKTIIEAAYDGLLPLNEEYLFYKTGTNESGIITSTGKKIITGNYNNAAYIGVGYILLEEAIPCDLSHPKSYEENNTYYYFNYSLFSVKENKIIKCKIIDEISASDATMIAMDYCLATEDNIILDAYYVNESEHKGYVYFIEKDETVVVPNYTYWKEDGCVTIVLRVETETVTEQGFTYDATREITEMRDSKGNKIESCEHLDSNQTYEIISKDGFDGVVDASDKEIIPCMYDEIISYTEDIFAVRLNSSWGFIDKSGKFLCDPTIAAEYNSSENYFTINDTPCVINPYTGQSTQYEYLKSLDEIKGTYSAYNGEGRAIVTNTVNLTDFIYDENGNSIEISEDGKVYVAANGSTYDIYAWD